MISHCMQLIRLSIFDPNRLNSSSSLDFSHRSASFSPFGDVRGASDLKDSAFEVAVGVGPLRQSRDLKCYAAFLHSPSNAPQTRGCHANDSSPRPFRVSWDCRPMMRVYVHHASEPRRQTLPVQTRGVQRVSVYAPRVASGFRSVRTSHASNL
jgi:hypothetical protein